MKAIIAALSILIAAAPAIGVADEVKCGTSERIDRKLIRPGDSDRRVIEADPDRRVRLETRHGGAAGYRYEFYMRNKTVQIYVSSGVVVRVCRVYE